MTMNPVQLQQGVSMAQFIPQHGTEAKCYRALYRSLRRSRCSRRPISRFRRAGRMRCQCRTFRHQITLTWEAVFESSGLLLITWFLAIYLLTTNMTNLSLLELERHLEGVLWPRRETQARDYADVILRRPWLEPQLRPVDRFHG